MTTRVALSDLPRIPPRDADAHKGSCGRVLVIAGSRGMTGAACLAALAAMRAGAGLVRVAVPAELEDIFETKLTAPLTLGVAGDGKGMFAEEAAHQLIDYASAWDAVVLGPGIGQSTSLQRFVKTIVTDLAKPLVVDADALNNLRDHPESLDDRPGPTVVTPHPGEMARLLGVTPADVQHRRAEIAERFARDHRVVVLLKGHRTVVTDADRTYVNFSGNPGLASGGTGDVLCGIIAVLMAQGFDPFDSAALGAFIHGLAGDIAARELTETALTADDLLEAVAAAWAFAET